jgi:hypothetical protein
VFRDLHVVIAAGGDRALRNRKRVVPQFEIMTHLLITWSASDIVTVLEDWEAKLVTTKDWRLRHLETQPYLRGVSFIRRPYRATRPGWEHDHCVACWATLIEPGMIAGWSIDKAADVVHEGYATTANFTRGPEYDWVCVPCFQLFREVMGWKDVY